METGDLFAYLAEVEMAFVSSPIVARYEIVRCWVNTDDGYIRILVSLVNGDFLEASEYFVLGESRIVTVDYRYQWMDGEKKVLRRRWDSTTDHPELGNFPHHVHIGSEENIVSGYPMSLIDLLKTLEDEIALP